MNRLPCGDTCPLLHVRRMNDGDCRVALEVGEVETEDRAHLVNTHRSNDSGIVDLNPGDSVLKHELSPCWENLGRLWKEPQECLKAIHASSCLLGREAETISAGRPRRGVPEFDEVLRKANELLTLAVE